MTRLATAAFVVFLCCSASGQEQFEVASVRKIAKDEGTRTITFAPERFEALLPLRTMILMAYDLRDYQVSGGPGWIHSDLFLVLAKAPGKASNVEMRRMLQHLLASDSS